jgi:predicted TPR repeat methyltransferase
MSDSWDDYAEEWDTNSDAISYSENAYETLVLEVNIQGLNILDFGCGTGLLTEKMASSAKSIVALDLSAKMIDVLNSKNLPNVISISEPLTPQLIKANTAFINKFEVIVASSVFSFLPEYASTLKLLKSLLAPGGLLLQWDWLSLEPDSEFGLSEKNVRNSLREAGFDQISITKPFSLASSKGTMPVVMGVAKNA